MYRWMESDGAAGPGEVMSHNLIPPGLERTLVFQLDNLGEDLGFEF